MARTLIIPENLTSTYWIAGDFVNIVVNNVTSAPLTLDMSRVTFVYPYGVTLLLSLARYVFEQTGTRIRLVNLDPHVGSYLDRVDLFKQGEAWLEIQENPEERFARSFASTNLVEVRALRTPRQQTDFLSRSRGVLETWLADDANEIDRIFSVLSEICSNAREHSNDYGHAMVQRYVRGAQPEVHIAVVDLGIGIKQSLLQSHEPSIASSPEEFIQRALQGFSARGLQAGGAGLQMVQDRIAQSGGELAVRSDAGFVSIENNGPLSPSSLPYFPGTQVCVTLRSR